MSEIILVNPSANMKRIAQELRVHGNSVTFVKTREYPPVNSKRVFYFFAGYNACFTQESQGEFEKEDKVLLVKPGILSRFRMINVGSSLAALNPELSVGNLTDLLMFKRGMLLREELDENIKEFSDFEEVAAYYTNKKIITSRLPSNSGISLCRFETDFDLEVTFRDDYFVFFGDSGRLEAFVDGNNLVTLSKEKNHIGFLMKIIPTFKKFSFKLVNEVHVNMNFNPWVTKGSSAGVYLINDYSFGRTSVSMASNWYEKIAGYIHFDKSIVG